MSVPRPLTPGTLWNRARDWNLSIFKSESFPNIHPCIPPFIFHSFEARTRWSIDMHLLVHPIFITHVHAHMSFLLRRLYLFPSEGRREIIPSNISLRRTKFSKILLDLVPFRYLKILSRNIYIYIYPQLIRRSFLRKRLEGRGVYLQQRESYEVLKDSDRK